MTVDHVCATCKYCQDPMTNTATWCNLYKDPWGAQIALLGREINHRGCDRWAAAKLDKKRYAQDSADAGFPVVKVIQYHHELYGQYTQEQLSRLLKVWEDDRNAAPELCGIVIDTAPLPHVDWDPVTAYTVFDNRDGELWMEDFFSRPLAMRWLSGEYSDVDDLHQSDTLYVDWIRAQAINAIVNRGAKQ